MAGSPDRMSDTFTPDEQAQLEADIDNATRAEPIYRDRIDTGERIPTSLAEAIGDEERARTGL